LEINFSVIYNSVGAFYFDVVIYASCDDRLFQDPTWAGLNAGFLTSAERSLDYLHACRREVVMPITIVEIIMVIL
jgi:hypothetical protein